MNLELGESPKLRSANWMSDAFLISIWTVWMMVIVSFELPKWLQMSGLPILLVYGSGIWGLRWGALLLLIISWIYSALSLAPSGLLWLSFFLSFAVIKFWRFRFYIQGKKQFAWACFSCAALTYILQLFFYKASTEGIMLSYSLIASLLALCILNAFAGYLLYGLFKKLSIDS